MIDNPNQKSGSDSPYITQFNVLNTVIISGDIKNGKIRHNLNSEEYSFFIADYDNGEINGIFSLYNKKGIKVVYQQMKQGKRDGMGREFNNVGSLILEAEYKNDKKHGIEKHFEERILSDIFIYEDGKKVLKLVKSGEIYEEIDVNSNTILGKCTYDSSFHRDGICYFYNDGQIFSIQKYDKGEMVYETHKFVGDTMTEFDEKGSELYCGAYEDSYLKQYPRHGQGKEYSGGVLVYEGAFVNNQREGFGVSYKNAQKVYEGEWKENLPDGEGKYYNDSDEFLYQGVWKEGYLEIEKGKYYNFTSNAIEFTKPRKKKSLKKSSFFSNPAAVILSVIGVVLLLIILIVVIVYLNATKDARAGIYTATTRDELTDIRVYKKNLKTLILDGDFDDPSPFENMLDLSDVAVETVIIKRATLVESLFLFDLPNLHTLTFESGCLTKGNLLYFKNLPKLKELVIPKNTFSTFTSFSLQEMNGLELIRFEGQNFQDADMFGFDSIPWLYTLLRSS